MKKICEEYQRLVARALEIVDGAPYWSHISSGDISEFGFAQLTIDGDKAVLFWPCTESDWDSCMLSSDSREFPALLLEMHDAELVKWKKNQRAKYDLEQAKKQTEQAAQTQKEERWLYDRLKAKYEPSAYKTGM